MTALEPLVERRLSLALSCGYVLVVKALFFDFSNRILDLRHELFSPQSLTLTLLLLWCSKLSSLSLVPLTAKCHSLSTFILAGAVVFPDGLQALSKLKELSKLDLSYTEIESLEPIFEACSQLKVRGFGFWKVGFVWAVSGRCSTPKRRSDWTCPTPRSKAWMRFMRRPVTCRRGI